MQAQVDQRFDIFDWEIIGNNESINSISEGYQYIFFATNGNGVLRYNKFSRKFDQSLSLGQGIKSKKINHVYFDKNTGILWLVGSKNLEFSNSREGNWNQIDYRSMPIKSFNDIKDIGSSSNYLWIKTFFSYIKLDHVSGRFLGLFSSPDEKVHWGDFNYQNSFQIKNLKLEDFFVENGWLLTAQGAANQNGIFSTYISFLETENNLNWIGLSNGYILMVDNFSKTITPLIEGIEVSIPFTLSVDKKIWIAGIGNGKISSISSISKKFENVKNFKDSRYSNFSYSDIFSSKVIDEEIWFGSDGNIIIYNQEKDFFRTLGYEKGIPAERIYFVECLENKVYIGSKNDLIVIDKKTKKIINSDISDLIKKNNLFIDDFNIIGDRIFFISQGKIYEFDSQEKINIDRHNNFLQNEFKSLRVFGDEDNKYFVTDRGILNNLNDKLIPSSIYFNYKISDILVTNNLLYIGTNGGLIIYDHERDQINNFFEFSFIKNIFDMEQVDEYLVLLSSSGLIKLKLSL
tara:strand:- start:1495 stop:3045 length:1551 start_codon:yes stop_codon:yes gene_type:complete